MQSAQAGDDMPDQSRRPSITDYLAICHVLA